MTFLFFFVTKLQNQNLSIGGLYQNSMQKVETVTGSCREKARLEGLVFVWGAICLAALACFCNLASFLL